MESKSIHQIELSRLADVLESALDATTKTKLVLHGSCDVAQHLLSNWHIPDATVREEQLHSSCDGNYEDSEVNEVARNIDQVVKQAQKLRETLSASQLQPNCPRLTKKSDVQKISSQCGFGSKKLHDNEQKKTHGAKFSLVNTSETYGFGPSSAVKGRINKHSVRKRSSSDSYSLRTTPTNTNQQSVPITVINGNYAKKAVTKPRFKSSPSLQTTYQQDFSVRTNHTIAKNNTAASSHLKSKKSLVNDDNTAILSKNTDSVSVNTDRNPHKSNSTSFPEELGISDLEDLLSRVTVHSNIKAHSGIKNTVPELKVNSLLSYSDKTAGITEEAYRVVGIGEALDILGVPADLVRVLKTYHRFLAETQEGKKRGFHTGKRQAAAESFLTKLSTVNKASWQQLAHEPLVRLFSEYMALLSEVSSVLECKFKDTNDETLACVQQKLELLERKHRKWSTVDESIFTQPKTQNHNGIIDENNECNGYAIIGVWNSNSIWRFKALAEMQYIRYSSEAQWKKFEANVQEIQMMELQTEILEVLKSFILPQLMNYDVQDPTFPKLYKTVCLLCNMTLLTSPIVIKSC